MKKKSTVVAAAATIVGLGERQKTMVEQKRKVSKGCGRSSLNRLCERLFTTVAYWNLLILFIQEERERQQTMIRDRIMRVRYERTMTMKEPKSESKGFDHILTREEAEGLSPEDRMKLIAAKMEQKFKVEERRASTTVRLSL